MTREMGNYYTIIHHMDVHKPHYYTFHPKSEKAVKAVIRHLPDDTLAENISNALAAVRFSVVSVSQMMANRPEPHRSW